MDWLKIIKGAPVPIIPQVVAIEYQSPVQIIIKNGRRVKTLF
jgi:hypothetical protein